MIDPKKTVGEIATDVPKSMRVFERHGIDYSCCGERTLVGVCVERDIPVERLVAEIESSSLPPSPRSPPKFDRLTELIDHIVSMRHAHARTELWRLLPLAAQVSRADRSKHAELERVCELVQELADCLGPHFETEERVLFPQVIALQAASSEWRAPPSAPTGSIRRPIATLRAEHAVIAQLLRDLRTTSRDYALPDEASESYRALYAGLSALERALHEDLHLENNVLFPAAERLERRLRDN